jgi:hypothetical protein
MMRVRIVFCFLTLLVACALYQPNEFVKTFSGIPPQNNFDPTKQYVLSALIVPLIIFFTSLAILFGYVIYSTMKYCNREFFPSYKLAIFQSTKLKEENIKSMTFEEKKHYYRYSIRSFFVCISLAFSANALVFIGDRSLTNSLNDTATALNYATNILDDVGYYSSVVKNSMTNLTKLASRFPCIDALKESHIYSQFTYYTSTSISVATQLQSFSEESASLTSYASTTTTNVVLPYKDLVVFVYFCIIALMIVLFGIAFFRASRRMFYYLAIGSCLIVLFLTLLHSAILFLLVSPNI